MQTDILLIGTISLAVWAFVWLRAARSSLGWASPTCLFATGVLVFYIIPSLYWQFRPWDYAIPPYYDGLPLVLASAVVLGFPFVMGALLGMGRKRIRQPKLQLRKVEFGGWLWVLLVPVFVGIGWRIYLLSLGWQVRLPREMPSLLGSEELALIANNLPFYYAACYFVLVAFGNKVQQKIGVALWVMDGLFQIFLLHRYVILLFMLRSAVFAAFLGWRLRWRQWAIAGVFVLLVMAVIGQSHIAAYDRVTAYAAFLTPFQVAGVLQETGVRYFEGDFWGGHSSDAGNILLRIVDDTMFRFYDARSASAVMMSVPDVIPYFYGETFLQLFYALVPRYFWGDKPSLREIHLVTTWVMPGDSGVNPTGTLAEFYMNYGFVAVLLGGIVSVLLCWWGERGLSNKRPTGPALLCVYPILAELYINANETFTRRLSEGLRGLLVLVLIALLLWFAKKRRVRVAWLRSGPFVTRAQTI